MANMRFVGDKHITLTINGLNKKLRILAALPVRISKPFLFLELDNIQNTMFSSAPLTWQFAKVGHSFLSVYPHDYLRRAEYI